MRWQQRKYLYIGFGLLFFISFIATYVILSYLNSGTHIPSEPQARGETKVVKPIITKDTVITKEVYFLCGESKKNKVSNRDLKGLDYESLKREYPSKEGWSIEDTTPNVLVLKQQAQAFCPKHANYRHLGIEKGNLAIYQGPLGYDQILLSREDIPVEVLPGNLRAQLKSAGSYAGLSGKAKKELRETLQFPSDEKLNEAMQNFDEYRE